MPFLPLLTAALLGGAVLYALGSISLRAATRATPHGRVPSNHAESACRAAAVVLNANLNLAFWVAMAPGWGLLPGTAVALVGIGSAIPRVARRSRYQAVLGWGSWLMPMSWPSTAIGLVLLPIVLLAARVPRERTAFRWDAGTGVLELSGLRAIRGFRGGVCLGNLTFLFGTGPTPFRAHGISAHETAHTLNVAAFGSVWHLIGNGIEQNVRPFSRGARAYGELLAESLRPDPSQPALRHWS